MKLKQEVMPLLVKVMCSYRDWLEVHPRSYAEVARQVNQHQDLVALNISITPEQASFLLEMLVASDSVAFRLKTHAELPPNGAIRAHEPSGCDEFILQTIQEMLTALICYHPGDQFLKGCKDRIAHYYHVGTTANPRS